MERRDFLKLGALVGSLPEVTIARVLPEDIVTVSFEEHLSKNAIEVVQANLKIIFPKNKHVILMGGAKLTVVRTV